MNNMNMQYNSLVEARRVKEGTSREEGGQSGSAGAGSRASVAVRIWRRIRGQVWSNIISGNGFMLPLLLLLIIFRGLHVFLVCYSIFHIGFFVTSMWRNARNLGEGQSEKESY